MRVKFNHARGYAIMAERAYEYLAGKAGILQQNREKYSIIPLFSGVDYNIDYRSQPRIII